MVMVGLVLYKGRATYSEWSLGAIWAASKWLSLSIALSYSMSCLQQAWFPINQINLNKMIITILSA